MWALIKNNKVVRSLPYDDFTANDGIQHGRRVLTSWSNAKLAEIGVYKARNEPYDKNNVISTGYDDGALIDGEVVYTPITIVKDPAAILARAKTQKLSMLKAHVADLFRKGFVHNGNGFDCDAEALGNIDTEFMAASDVVNFPTWPNEYVWRAFDNSFVAMSRDDVIELGKAARQHKADVLKQKWTHETVIDALTDVQVIIDYDYTINFPVAAGE